MATSLPLTEEATEAVEMIASRLRADGGNGYDERTFRDLVPDLGRRSDVRPMLAREQVLLLFLLAAAVQSCDEVECDPVGTAESSFHWVMRLTQTTTTFEQRATALATRANIEYAVARRVLLAQGHQED